jgi:hypothetical protein
MGQDRTPGQGCERLDLRFSLLPPGFGWFSVVRHGERWGIPWHARATDGCQWVLGVQTAAPCQEYGP